MKAYKQQCLVHLGLSGQRFKVKNNRVLTYKIKMGHTNDTVITTIKKS